VTWNMTSIVDIEEELRGLDIDILHYEVVRQLSLCSQTCFDSFRVVIDTISDLTLYVCMCVLLQMAFALQHCNIWSSVLHILFCHWLVSLPPFVLLKDIERIFRSVKDIDPIHPSARAF
jgi:hypothetical protein